MPDLKPWQVLAVRARKDFRSAKALYTSDDFEYEVVGLLLHQCAEKSLKSILDFNGIQFPHTHDLRALITLIEKIPSIGSMEEFYPLIDINPFAVHFRYMLYEEESPDWEILLALLESLLSRVEHQ